MALASGKTENADCCESISLPGGTFEMGESVSGKNRCPATDFDAGVAYCNSSEQPAHSVTISPYALDRFEVTVARFRKFVDAWNYQGLPEGAGGDGVVAGVGWQTAWNVYLPTSRDVFAKDLESCATAVGDLTASTWTSLPGYYESHPINCLSWYEAFAFCVWDGGRLPTEAEWEFAAANGPQADLYPWGEAVPTPSSAVDDCTEDPNPCEVAPPIPAYVGSLPTDSNIWGHRDLAGNVSEWVFDSVSAYGTSAVTNPASVGDGFRIIRGGAFTEGPSYLRATARDTAAPASVGSVNGVRCARTL